MSTPSSLPEDAAGAELARRVREARSKIGMTRKQLAAASGASERYLALIEAGTGNPSFSVLQALAEALGAPVCELLPLGGEASASVEEVAKVVRRLSPARLSALQDWLNQVPAGAEEKAGRIVLLGLRGAGKSSLGAALAERLKLPFFEVFRLVEDSYGGGIGTIFELGGQAALRRYEEDVWSKLFKKKKAVIAAPGGIVADGGLFDRVLAGANTIWLRATPEDHMSRVMEQGDFRPMQRNPGAMKDLKTILEARAPEYARADMEIDTSAQGFEETLDLIEAAAKKILKG